MTFKEFIIELMEKYGILVLDQYYPDRIKVTGGNIDPDILERIEIVSYTENDDGLSATLELVYTPKMPVKKIGISLSVED